jgi:hypothetical protein
MITLQTVLTIDGKSTIVESVDIPSPKGKYKDLKIWRLLNFYKRIETENHKEAVKDGIENIMRVGY